MSELQFINLNERAYKYIRQFTIKSAEDALIELITNCIDAYGKGNILLKPMEIEYLEPGILKIRDLAIGLSGEDMEKCFLQVGNYTNIEGSRGFFSRGAKDISAIGNITFETIKDNKYSKVYLNSDAYGLLEINEDPVTALIRENLKIPEPHNGMVVTIHLLSNFINFNPSDQAESLSKLAVLRDIMSNSNNEIYYSHVNEIGEVLFRRRLAYQYPNGTLLLDIEYTVPGYEESTAKFVVYKTDTPIKQPKKENEMEFGFLIKDETTVYESSTIDDRFRWNPYMPYLFGYLRCDKIHDLLMDFDTSGSSVINPVPIIDPSRLAGVNKDHPFIMAMLSIPKVRLDQILRELNSSISSKSITMNEIGNLFDELSKYGLNLVEEEEVKVSFTPSYDKELAKAIEDDRFNFVNSEKNYLLTKDYNTTLTNTDQYIREEILKIAPKEDDQSYIYIMGEDKELIPIPRPAVDKEFLDVNILETIGEENESLLQKRPYIYELNSDGELVKLYIFQKGQIENVTNPENEYVLIKNKKFDISFINDINLTQRYIIEYSDGIDIKINTNSYSVKKYMTLGDLNAEQEQELTIKNIGSAKSLLFIKELLLDIMSEIIVENDIINNKLILDSNTYNNAKKINSHKNNIVFRLERPIEGLFDTFLEKAKQAKSGVIDGILDQLSIMVSAKMGDVEDNTDMINMKAKLQTTLNKLIE